MLPTKTKKKKKEFADDKTFEANGLVGLFCRRLKENPMLILLPQPGCVLNYQG